MTNPNDSRPPGVRLRAGRAWLLGDDIDTDLLAPGKWMKHPIEIVAAHCLEDVFPEFAKQVRPGDIVVAGERFGIGSSREQATEALRFLGVQAVLAASYGGIFFRNALNLGLPALTFNQQADIQDGDLITIDPATGAGFNESRGITLQADPLPDFLIDMLKDGGLIPHLEQRFANQH